MILMTSRWRPWKPLSSKNVNLLYKTQTKMTELELLPLPESLEEAPPTPPPEIVKAAKEINCKSSHANLTVMSLI